MFCRRYSPGGFSCRISPVAFSGGFPRWNFSAFFSGIFQLPPPVVFPMAFHGGISGAFSDGFLLWPPRAFFVEFQGHFPMAFPGGISGAFSSSFLRWLFPAVSSSGISEVFFLRHCRRIFITLFFDSGFAAGRWMEYVLPRQHRPAGWWWRRVVRVHCLVVCLYPCAMFRNGPGAIGKRRDTPRVTPPPRRPG